MAKLGYVGLGVMGGRMADRLISKGHTVVGYNRTRDKAKWLVDRGLTLADTPRAVAESADAVFVMVTDSAALDAVTRGPDGILAGLGPGKLLIDMSTVSPAVSRAVAAQVKERGADMVDAPVSGSPVTLEQGKLSMMVGGTRAAFERAQATARRYRTKGDARRRPGPGGVDEDRDEPERGGADAGLLRGRAAGGEERDRSQDGGRGVQQQRDRVAHASIPWTDGARPARRRVVYRHADAERRIAGARDGAPA